MAEPIDPSRDVSGPTSPLESVYRTRRQELTRVAFGFTHDQSAATDLVQDAFVRVMRARRTPKAEEELFYYLIRVVVNLGKNHLRQTSRREPPPGQGYAKPCEDSASDNDVLKAIASLPQRQREVVFLRFWLDLTSEQTAAAMGTSVGTVKKHSARALSRLGPLFGGREQ